MPPRGMIVDFVGRPVGDINAAAVGLPSGNTGSVVLVGVGDAAVVLFLELVFDGVRAGIAAQPEVLDEALALLIGLQPHEGGPFLVGDDVDDVLVQPLAIRRGQLFAQRLFLGLALLIGHRPSDRLGRLLSVFLGSVFLVPVAWVVCCATAKTHDQKQHGHAENRKASSFHTAHRFLGTGLYLF